MDMFRPPTKQPSVHKTRNEMAVTYFSVSNKFKPVPELPISVLPELWHINGISTKCQNNCIEKLQLHKTFLFCEFHQFFYAMFLLYESVKMDLFWLHLAEAALIKRRQMGEFIKSAFGYFGNVATNNKENELVGQSIEVGKQSFRIRRVIAEGTQRLSFCLTYQVAMQSFLRDMNPQKGVRMPLKLVLICHYIC